MQRQIASLRQPLRSGPEFRFKFDSHGRMYMEVPTKYTRQSLVRSCTKAKVLKFSKRVLLVVFYVANLTTLNFDSLKLSVTKPFFRR
jgi:hypothetical protein